MNPSASLRGLSLLTTYQHEFIAEALSLEFESRDSFNFAFRTRLCSVWVVVV